MAKKLQIINDLTGEVLEEQEFSGGYHIIYTNLEDMGKLRHIRKLGNARFGDKHWIKNWIYKPIAKKLVNRFPEIKHINHKYILFI